MQIGSFKWNEWEPWAERLIDESRSGCQHGVILISVSMMELLLDKLLETSKIPAKLKSDLGKLSFSEKISICSQENLVDNHCRRSLHAMRIIRNTFAHCHDANLNDKFLLSQIAIPLNKADDGGLQKYDALMRFRIGVEFVVSDLATAISKSIDSSNLRNIP